MSTDVGGVTAEQLRSYIERVDHPTFSEIIEYLSINECWRKIKDAPEYYISSFGRVKGKRTDILTPIDCGTGYLVVSLSVNGNVRNERISRLVLKSFIGEPVFEDAHAAHNDGNTLNNNILNLRWATSYENQRDVNRHGHRIRGSAVVQSKLKEEDIPIIRQRIANGERYPIIAKDYEVSVSTISLIKKGKIWNHVE